MDLLARREHSRVELEQKLHIREYENAEIELALNELSEQGLQSDARFTEHYIQYRANKGYGPHHIRAELSARGVSDADIHEQMQYYDQSFWEDCCEKVLLKKFAAEAPEDFPAKIKRLKFLQYRGFSVEMSNRCLENIYENQ